jgi:murein L,D-transpeptidase YafK
LNVRKLVYAKRVNVHSTQNVNSPKEHSQTFWLCNKPRLCSGFVIFGRLKLHKQGTIKMKLPYPFLLCSLFVMPIMANATEKADHVVVEKSKHLLSLFKSNQRIATYHIELGSNPIGPKQRENDGKTPEGNYILDIKKADSAFYKAIHISYPSTKDLENAHKLGVSAGGDIMIHGQKNGFGWASALTQKFNWTKGCIALNDKDMNDVWTSVDAGTTIEIKP